MAEQLRLHGGPLEGLYVDADKVVDGKFKAGIERESYRPNPKFDVQFAWKIAEAGRAPELYVTYVVRDGLLCYPGWRPVPKKVE